MKRGVALLFLSLSMGSTFGESNGTTSIEIKPTPQKRDGVTVFSDEVFKVGQPPAVNETTTSPMGSKRPLERSNENSAQIDARREKCEPLRKRSMKAYRECYQSERREEARSVRESVEAVERRQAIPFRNSQSLPTIGGPDQDSGFGGVEIESQDD